MMEAQINLNFISIMAVKWSRLISIHYYDETDLQMMRNISRWSESKWNKGLQKLFVMKRFKRFCILKGLLSLTDKMWKWQKIVSRSCKKKSSYHHYINIIMIFVTFRHVLLRSTYPVYVSIIILFIYYSSFILFIHATWNYVRMGNAASN